MEFVRGIRRSQRNNLCFTLRGGVFNTKVKAAPAQGIADAPLFVRCQHDEGNASGSDGAELRNAQLPNAKQFEQQGLKRVVYLVQFVDQQDTRPFALQRAQKWTGTKKLLAVQFGPEGLPVDIAGLGL